MNEEKKITQMAQFIRKNCLCVVKNVEFLLFWASRQRWHRLFGRKVIKKINVIQYRPLDST
jgi:hypothetical protein